MPPGRQAGVCLIVGKIVRISIATEAMTGSNAMPRPYGAILATVVFVLTTAALPVAAENTRIDSCEAAKKLAPQVYALEKKSLTAWGSFLVVGC
jgi:hypothetical protein